MKYDNMPPWLVWTLGVLGLILGGATIFFGLQIQYLNVQNANLDFQKRTYADRMETADQIAIDCTQRRVVPAYIKDCIREKFEAYQRKDIENRDLQAQTSMAFWALWLTIISAGGTALSFVGVLLMRRSLRHTETAISDNREIGEKGVRAYVGLKVIKDHFLLINIWEIGKKVHIDFNFENLGETPAKNVRYVACCQVMDHTEGEEFAKKFRFHPEAPNSSVTIQKEGVSPAEVRSGEAFSTKDNKSVFVEKNKYLYLFIRIEYVDVFGKKHRTDGCFFCEGTIHVGSSYHREYDVEWYQAPFHNGTEDDIE